jgi:deoxycytidine triphosphate deaminase
MASASRAARARCSRCARTTCPSLVEDGQAFFRLAFYHAQELPERSYGQGGSHYQGQALELSKHFTRPTV